MIKLTYEGLTEALKISGQGTKQQVLKAIEQATPAELTMLAHSFIKRASDLREQEEPKVLNCESLKEGFLYDGPVYHITETAERYQVWSKEQLEDGSTKIRLANSLSKRCNKINDVITFYSQTEKERSNS